jgi:hypothetical protein
MFSLLFFLIHPVWGHAPVSSMKCSHKSEVVQISPQKNNWLIQLPNSTDKIKVQKPKSQDTWDPKLQQLFDVYEFQIGADKAQLKIPEGPGPVKIPQLTYKDTVWECRPQTK